MSGAPRTLFMKSDQDVAERRSAENAEMYLPRRSSWNGVGGAIGVGDDGVWGVVVLAIVVGGGVRGNVVLLMVV